ncbi:MAG: (Fe-S)-binding protein [Oceanipulchritudo sp.]
METPLNKPSPDPRLSPERDPLRACVHCGLCLESCPTYRLTGDENNSPRGRLLLWRAEAEGTLEVDPWTNFYTEECVGCLACESVCPANVPYGDLLETTRAQHYREGRSRPDWRVALAGRAVRRPRLFNLALAPARALRRARLLPHRMLFPGKPAVRLTTAAYAKTLMKRHRPSGPAVALLTGCLMEGLFREINFATVRVLIENNIRVFIPEGQGCCGALHEHTGLPGWKELAATNRAAFDGQEVERVLANSAGCGLALGKALAGKIPVQDVLGYLAGHGLKQRSPREGGLRVFVDLPCHLVHGQGVGLPESVLEATGYDWEWAPCAEDCCGSGGVYNLQKPERAREILREKADFLNRRPAGSRSMVATSNHVCMMQWSTARSFVKRPFEVCHVIQLLDPGPQF